MNRYFINKIENMRDIGGYKTTDNKKVKSNMLVRSNCPTTLTKLDIDSLVEKGFKVTIDLRNEKEIKNTRSNFADDRRFHNFYIKINGDGKLPKSKDYVLDSYIEMIEQEGKKEIEEIFNILDEFDGGIIYYCSAGKDRTGVITSLILKTLGVYDDDIIEDYLASGIFLKQKLQQYIDKNKVADLSEIIIPRYDVIKNFLDYIDNTYGNIENYLKTCNISIEKIKRIREKYTI